MMKDRRFVCLFCSHSLLPHPNFQTTKRWISSRQREPYVLPRLIIDLDATDNAQVKQFEDLPPDAQRRNLKGYTKLRYVGGKGNFIKYVKPRTPPSWYKFDLDRNFATPTDLLSYALLGESDDSFAAKRNRGRIYQKVGIQPQDGVLRKLQEVASSFVVDDRARFKKSGFIFDKEHIQSLRKRIEDCHDIDSLQVLISMFSPTKEGCECLAQNGDAISASIRLCRRRQGEVPGASLPVSKVLRLLNNLHRSMELKGVQMGAALCNRGLYYAAKSGSLPAVKMYLQISQQNKYEIDFYGNQTPIELLVSYLESSESPTQSHKNNFLTLLTGYSSDLRTETKSEPNFSLRTLINGKTTHRNMLYRKYLFTIAQLGLTSTLWREWSDVLVVNPSNKYQTQRAYVFALAFSIAGDSAHAKEVLSSISPDAEIAKPGSHNGRHEANALRSIVYDHYKARNLEAPPQFWQRVSWEMQNIPSDAEEALEVLERWLVRDYESGIGVVGRKRRIQLEVVEGNEVLMVWPLRKGKPLFAKILSRTGSDESG